MSNSLRTNPFPYRPAVQGRSIPIAAWSPDTLPQRPVELDASRLPLTVQIRAHQPIGRAHAGRYFGAPAWASSRPDRHASLELGRVLRQTDRSRRPLDDARLARVFRRPVHARGGGRRM